jgi:MFS family permease
VPALRAKKGEAHVEDAGCNIQRERFGPFVTAASACLQQLESIQNAKADEHTRRGAELRHPASLCYTSRMRGIPPNVLKYYLLRLMSGVIFTYVIQAIYLLSRGISVSQLATYASLTVIFSTLLEIPTGFLADRFGRKYSVSLSYFAGGLSNIAFVYANDFSWLVVISFLTGLSSALSSGALESLIYDEIQANGSGLNFLKVTTTGTNIALISAAFASFVSPLIYVANPIAPFVLTATVDMTLAFFVLFFKEKRRAHEVFRKLKMIEGIKTVWKIAPIKFIVLIDLCLLIFVNIYYKVLFFPKITGLGLNVQYLGVVDVITLAITSVMLYVIPKVSFKNEKTSLAVYSLSVAAMFALFGLSLSLAPALIFGMLFDPLWNIRRHIIPTITNKYFETYHRALALSSMSFISSLGAALLVPIAIIFFTQSYWFTLIPLIAILMLLFKYPNEYKLRMTAA